MFDQHPLESFPRLFDRPSWHSGTRVDYEDEDHNESLLEAKIEELQTEDFNAMLCESISESSNAHRALIKAALDADDAIALLQLIKSEYNDYCRLCADMVVG